MELKNVTYDNFIAALNKAQDISPLIKKNTTPAYAIAYNPGTRYYLSKDCLSGLAISEDGELTSLISNVKGNGDTLVSFAVSHGALHLNCFEGYLPSLYARHGFKRVRRDKNWVTGGPDIVYMVRDAGIVKVKAGDLKVGDSFYLQNDLRDKDKIVSISYTDKMVSLRSLKSVCVRRRTDIINKIRPDYFPKMDRYARDLKVGDKLFHWDGEGKPETIKSIMYAYSTSELGEWLDDRYLVIECQTFIVTVHVNDIRKVCI